MPIDNHLDAQQLVPEAAAVESGFPTTPTAIDPNNPPYSLLGAFVVWLVSLVIQIIVPALLLIPYAFSQGAVPSSPSFKEDLLRISVDRTGILIQVISLFPIHLLTFGMVWALVTRFRKYPFLETIGWSWSPRIRIGWSIFLGCLLCVSGMGLAYLVGDNQPTLLDQIVKSSLAARIALALLATFSAPFVEEFVYRGILFGALQKLGGAITASVVTFGLFTLIHVPQYWPNFGVLAAICFLTLALTIVRAKTGRLLPCIVIHFVFNGIQSVILIVEPYFSKPVPVPEPVPAMILSWLGLF